VRFLEIAILSGAAAAGEKAREGEGQEEMQRGGE
jgi:hypothetical protein